MERKVKEEQRIAQDAKLYVINTHDICIDGRVIDHYTENQFHEHNEASYRAGATKEAARNKEDAIGFGWWIFENNYRRFTDGEFGCWQDSNDAKLFTTEQLYEIFINQKV